MVAKAEDRTASPHAMREAHVHLHARRDGWHEAHEVDLQRLAHRHPRKLERDTVSSFTGCRDICW